MKKSLLKLCLVALTAISLHAEADFDQVQNLIGNGKYEQAVMSLKVIVKNHPNSAKVQYTLAQAQAGLGNLPAAKEALEKAKAIDPDLKFVSKSQVQELSEVINAVRVIKKVESSSHWFLWFTVLAGGLGAVWYFFVRKKEPVQNSSSSSTKYDQPKQTYTSSTMSTPASPSYNDRPVKTEQPTRSSFGTYGYDRQAENRSNREPVTREVHHYHDNHNDSGLGTVGNIAVAAGTAAVVSSMMNDHSNSNHESSYNQGSTINNYNYQTVNETESSNDNISDTWEDKEEISKSWDSESDNNVSNTCDSDSDNESSSWEE